MRSATLFVFVAIIKLGFTKWNGTLDNCGQAEALIKEIEHEVEVNKTLDIWYSQMARYMFCLNHFPAFGGSAIKEGAQGASYAQRNTEALL